MLLQLPEVMHMAILGVHFGCSELRAKMAVPYTFATHLEGGHDPHFEEHCFKMTIRIAFLALGTFCTTYHLLYHWTYFFNGKL